MDARGTGNQTVDLLTSIPGRTERRLVPGVSTASFTDVLSAVGQRWNVRNVQGYAVSCFSSRLNLSIEIASQAEWEFIQSKGFFVSETNELGLLQLEFHMLDEAAPSQVELIANGKSGYSALEESLKAERAAHDSLKVSHEAQAAEVLQLKAVNAAQAAELKAAKLTITEVSESSKQGRSPVTNEAARPVPRTPPRIPRTPPRLPRTPPRPRIDIASTQADQVLCATLRTNVPGNEQEPAASASRQRSSSEQEEQSFAAKGAHLDQERRAELYNQTVAGFAAPQASTSARKRSYAASQADTNEKSYEESAGLEAHPIDLSGSHERSDLVGSLGARPSLIQPLQREPRGWIRDYLVGMIPERSNTSSRAKEAEDSSSKRSRIEHAASSTPPGERSYVASQRQPSHAAAYSNEDDLHRIGVASSSSASAPRGPSGSNQLSGVEVEEGEIYSEDAETQRANALHAAASLAERNRRKHIRSARRHGGA